MVAWERRVGGEEARRKDYKGEQGDLWGAADILSMAVLSGYIHISELFLLYASNVWSLSDVSDATMKLLISLELGSRV